MRMKKNLKPEKGFVAADAAVKPAIISRAIGGGTWALDAWVQ
jgi:hypothetical protein